MKKKSNKLSIFIPRISTLQTQSKNFFFCVCVCVCVVVVVGDFKVAVSLCSFFSSSSSICPHYIEIYFGNVHGSKFDKNIKDPRNTCLEIPGQVSLLFLVGLHVL